MGQPDARALPGEAEPRWRARRCRLRNISPPMRMPPGNGMRTYDGAVASLETPKKILKNSSVGWRSIMTTRTRSTCRRPSTCPRSSARACRRRPARRPAPGARPSAASDANGWSAALSASTTGLGPAGGTGSWGSGCEEAIRLILGIGPRGPVSLDAGVSVAGVSLPAPAILRSIRLSGGRAYDHNRHPPANGPFAARPAEVHAVRLRRAEHDLRDHLRQFGLAHRLDADEFNPPTVHVLEQVAPERLGDVQGRRCRPSRW